MKRQGHLSRVSSIIAVSLFSIYLSADLINSLHSSILHNKVEEEVCTIDNEDDACHQAIYHNVVAESCEHDAHIIPQIVDCELCSVVLNRHVLPQNNPFLVKTTKHLSVVNDLEQIAPKIPYQYVYPQRGPPLFS